MNRLVVGGGLVGVAAAVALGLAMAVGGRAQAAVDLRVLFQQQTDAQNRGDVAAVMDTYADDAVVRGGALCMAAPCVGKVAIQREVERRIAERTQIRIVSLREESSGVASGILETVEGRFASCGVQRILVNFNFVVTGDKMSSWTSSPDLSDEQSARFIACISAPTAVVAPPSTGDAGLAAAGR